MIDKKVQQVAARMAKETSHKLYFGLREHWIDFLKQSISQNLFFNLCTIKSYDNGLSYKSSDYDIMLNHLLEITGRQNVHFIHEIRNLHLHFSWKEHLCLINILKNNESTKTIA